MVFAIGAGITAIVSLNLAHGVPQDVHPNSAIAMGLASWVLGLAAEREA